MAEFDKGKLSAPQTQFQQVTARERPDAREGMLNTLVGGVSAGGKAYAKSSAEQVTGEGLSQADINNQADATQRSLDEQIGAAMDNAGGPVPERTQKEVKDRALSEFARNDRTLLELRDRGEISTSEARGRRMLNLKQQLSNPINALYRGEFLDAASSLTGGGKGAVQEAFPFTPDEIKQQAIDAEKVKAVAEHEGQIAGAVAVGIPEVTARREVKAEAESKIELAHFNRIKQDRSLNGEEFSKVGGLLRNSAARGVSLQIAQLSSANGGKGLTADNLQAVNRTLSQQNRGMLEEINANTGLGKAERESAREELKVWFEGMQAYVSSEDMTKLNEGRDSQLKSLIFQESVALFPEYHVANATSPVFLEAVIGQGGLQNIGNLDAFFGEGTGAKITSSADRLRAVTNYHKGKPPMNTDVAALILSTITLGGTTAGLDYVTSPTIQENPALKVNLKKAYDLAPAMSLQAYSTTDAQISAPKNGVLRSEINVAMVAAKNKMDRIKQMVGAEDEVIYAEAETPMPAVDGIAHGNPRVSLRPNKNPNWILNLPDAMQEHSQDLRAMHRMISKQPWSWNHVKSQYVDGNDAFNGYMRGEFEINVGMEDEPPEAASKPERFTETPTPSATSPLQGSLPDTPVQALTGNFEANLKTFENNKNLPPETSGWDGSTWKPHKSKELGTDTLAYGHKLTKSEASSGEIEIRGEKVDYQEGISDKQAEELFQQDLKAHKAKAQTAYPELNGSPLAAVTAMMYQGVNVPKWPEANTSIKKAIKTNTRVDWLAAQANILDSKWATEQTPERALQTVHLMYRDTPISVLEQILRGFISKRGSE